MTFDDIDDRRSFTSICSHWRTGARCTMWHVSRRSTRKLHVHVLTLQQLQSRQYYTLVSQWVSKLSFYLWLREVANLARLREIAKINTRKIVGIPKSQNFVLANNSNNKVKHAWVLAWVASRFAASSCALRFSHFAIVLQFS